MSLTVLRSVRDDNAVDYVVSRLDRAADLISQRSETIAVGGQSRQASECFAEVLELALQGARDFWLDLVAAKALMANDDAKVEAGFQVRPREIQTAYGGEVFFIGG